MIKKFCDLTNENFHENMNKYYCKVSSNDLGDRKLKDFFMKENIKMKDVVAIYKPEYSFVADHFLHRYLSDILNDNKFTYIKVLYNDRVFYYTEPFPIITVRYTPKKLYYVFYIPKKEADRILKENETQLSLSSMGF